MTSRLVVLALIALTLVNVFGVSTVTAQDDDDDGVPAPQQTGGEASEAKNEEADGETDDDENESLPEEEEIDLGGPGLNVKAIFLGNAANEQFLAGEWVETLVAFSNSDESSSYNVRFVAAHLNAVGDATAYIQNFTGNAYDRVVEGKETGTFKYRFKPHESLDPRDYNLVVRVFFTTNDNNTLAIAAFNGTITIQEPSGVDPQTITTFLTIGGLVAGAFYWFNSKKPKRSSSSSKPTAAPVEMGTDSAFDKNFVNPEHVKYMESLQRKSQSPKRTASKN